MILAMCSLAKPTLLGLGVKLNNLLFCGYCLEHPPCGPRVSVQILVVNLVVDASTSEWSLCSLSIVSLVLINILIFFRLLKLVAGGCWFLGCLPNGILNLSQHAGHLVHSP